MKILIDMLGYLTESRNRGIGRYTKELALSMSHLGRGNHDIHLLLNSSFIRPSKETFREFSSILGQDNIHFWLQPELHDVLDFSSPEYKAARAIYSAVVQDIEPDAVVFTEPFTQSIGFDSLSGSDIKKFPVIYDLIPAIYPEDYLSNPVQKKWYEHRMNESSSMDTILTISESSKSEIGSLIRGCGPIVSIGCDTSSNLEKYSEEFDSIGGLSFNNRKYILYAGGFDYRKSVDLLVKAHAEMNLKLGKSYSLVLAGKIPDLQLSELRDIARKAGSNDNVYFLGYVSDAQLSWLYKNCLVYVNPSKHEGFGLTILEAMRCGAPVLAADNTNTSELIEIDAAKFKTLDLDSLVEKLVVIASDDSVRQSIIKYGSIKEKQYSWEAIALAALNVIEQNITESTDCVKESRSRLDNFNALKRYILDQNFPDSSLIELARSVNGSMVNGFRSRSQLLVDISILIRTDAGSGVQRVVRSILNELLLTSPSYDVRPVYFCFEINEFKYADVEQDGEIFIFRLSNEVSRIDLYKGDVFLGLDLNHNLAVNHKNVLERLIYSPASIYFVVYDLLPIQFPHFFDEIHKLPELHAVWLDAVGKSDGVFCISKVVSEEIGSYFHSNCIAPHDGFINSWFKLGANFDHLLVGDKVPVKFSEKCRAFQDRTTLLMVGTLEPRKGHNCVLDAFDQLLENTDINLVLAGGRGWKSSQLIDRIESHPELNNRLFLYNGLDDQHLAELYNSSTGLIAASYGEGFGLPIIEASHYGVPVLARDIPVFREVGGNHVTYFQDESREHLASKIVEWLESVKGGFAQALDPSVCVSWSESAANLLERISESK